jgi:16S rRNA (guanine527-N7)-methyltransferase
MEKSKDFLLEYLRKYGLYSKEKEIAFEVYFEELLKTNQIINLFSRKTEGADLWVRHFLDSVSILEVYRDWSNKRVLDFGTGGGLPGVPLKIVEPSCQMTLLDSTKKKIEAVRKIVDKLGLQEISFFTERLEELDCRDYFEVIVCRSVRITPILAKALPKVLKKGGKIFLYKAVNYSDVDLFQDYIVHRLELKILGERRIVEITNG